MDKEKQIEYLWELPRNLCSQPRKVKVLKDCPKTYQIDKVCGKMVAKSFSKEPSNYVGFTNYCFYYSTEEYANNAYSRMKEQERQRAEQRKYYGDTKQAVKEFAEKLKTYAKENHGIQRDIVTVEEINNLFKELYGNES